MFILSRFMVLNQVKLASYRSLESCVEPFLGWQLGRKLPLLKRIYAQLKNSLSPTKVRIFGQWLSLHPDDQVFSREIISKGIFEEFEVELFSLFLRDGDVVFDIGANIGYYTLLAAQKVGETGRIYSFEPDVENFKILENNISANGHRNVIPLQYAVSDENGCLQLALSDKNKGDHRTYKVDNIPLERENYSVKSYSLDSYFEGNSQNPNVVKMDIQGFEYFALLGMSGIVGQKSNMALFTEFWPHGLKMAGLELPSDYLSLLGSLGFQIFQIDEDQKRISEISDIKDLTDSLCGESFTNLLCLKGCYLERAKTAISNVNRS